LQKTESSYSGNARKDDRLHRRRRHGNAEFEEDHDKERRCRCDEYRPDRPCTAASDGSCFAFDG
jgi:hypothetical protein